MLSDDSIPSFSWLSSIPSHTCTTSLSIHPWVVTLQGLFFKLFSLEQGTERETNIDVREKYQLPLTHALMGD